MKTLIYSLVFAPFSALAFTGEPTTAPSAVGVSSVSDFYDVIIVAAKWLVVFGIVIGAVFIIWGGVEYATSGGDESKTGSAKGKIIGGLIGIALVLIAYALVNIVGSFFGAGQVVSP
jgi:hypothetical protein